MNIFDIWQPTGGFSRLGYFLISIYEIRSDFESFPGALGGVQNTRCPQMRFGRSSRPHY